MKNKKNHYYLQEWIKPSAFCLILITTNREKQSLLHFNTQKFESFISPCRVHYDDLSHLLVVVVKLAKASI